MPKKLTLLVLDSRTTVLQSMKLGVDVNRHKEIIVKAISAVLLLLLKHFKLNHVYQVSGSPQHWKEGANVENLTLMHHIVSLSCTSSNTWPSILCLLTASHLY